jgi:hypothetical protein
MKPPITATTAAALPAAMKTFMTALMARRDLRECRIVRAYQRVI